MRLDCPVPAFRCRYSDALRAEYNPGIDFQVGYVARTTTVNSATINLTVDATNPTVRLVAEQARPVVGETANKVGRTTGWTAGAVTQTCISSIVLGENIIQLGQARVEAGADGGGTAGAGWKQASLPPRAALIERPSKRSAVTSCLGEIRAAASGPVITTDRSARSILLFWMPLAAQWLMMGLEGPFLAAVIARLADPAFNLAAYGVAFAFAILVESPVIMLMSASIALVAGAESYRRLRNFAHALNLFATALLLLVLVPAVYTAIMDTALGLPREVSELVYGALWLLLPWPAAIGYRRFLHGILIRSGRTRLVAYGTVLRLVGMAATALVLSRTALPGAWVGAAALSAGVLVEAIVAHFMAAPAVRELRRGAQFPANARTSDRKNPSLQPASGREAGAGGGTVVAAEQVAQREPEEPAAQDYGAIARFYYPLALTSLIGLTVQPMLTFFMGRSPAPVASLAVFPVVHSLSFLFNALALSFQEAAIALLGRNCEHARALGRFGAGLAVAASGGLALVAFTPLAGVWFETISGLPPDLAAIAVIPTRVLVLLPALSVLLAFQRAVLVQQRTTRPITAATGIEVAAIAALFPLFGWGIGLIGVTAAVSAFLAGRFASVLYLARGALRVLRRAPATRDA